MSISSQLQSVVGKRPKDMCVEEQSFLLKKFRLLLRVFFCRSEMKRNDEQADQREKAFSIYGHRCTKRKNFFNDLDTLL